MRIVILFIMFALLAAVLLYAAKKRVSRRAACFALYKVRDDLVCLVAEEKLSEEDEIFQYYYQRANAFLWATPNVGFDDALRSLISSKNGDVEKSIAQNKKKLSELQARKEMQVPEVRDAVANYYRAVFKVMLAHSSMSNFLYLKLMNERVTPLIKRWSPKFSTQIEVAKYAYKQEAKLREAFA